MSKIRVAVSGYGVIGRRRSLAYNAEVALTVRDTTVGATMDSLFLADLQYAEEIRLAAFRRRSWWMHLRERGASILADLL